MRFMQVISRFLYGRYGNMGIDSLNKLLMALAVILSVINLILKSTAIYLLQTAFVFWFFYRLLSRNIPARVSENEVLKRFFSKINSRLLIFKRRVAERKTHIYKTCPNCKAKLRFRRIKGKHNACCPKCKTNFTVIVR